MKVIKKMVQSFSSVISDRHIRNSGFNNFNTKYYNLKGLICGLLSVLFITLGLSLSINSNDSSALQYNIQKIPLNFPGSNTASPNFYSSANSFRIVTSDDISPSEMANQYVISMVNDNGTCKGRAYQSLPYAIDTSDNRWNIRYGFNGYNDINSLPPNFGSFDPCLSVDPLSNYDSTSVGNLAPTLGTPTSGELQRLLPYRFSYDGFYRTDTRNSDGLYYTNKFDLHNIFGPQGYPNAIYDLYIPFGSGKSDVSSTLTNDTPIEFSGEFVLDLADPSSAFGLTGSIIQLETYYAYSQGWSGPDVTDCTWSLAKDNPDDPTSVYSLSYSCPTTLRSASSWDPSDSFPYFRLHVHFNYETENTKFFQFIYDSSVSITDNDSTPGGDWDNPVQGYDTHSAPGSVYQQDYHDQNPDYELSLINLFNFTFINPFEPILHLFTDNGSCVQIPTIAGMIHSEEIQVCPWFDSNVRNIVTPVLGLSSMMLVFGFAIRWLGARSGNMFEDSFEGSSGGISIGTKGRSK